MTRSMMTLVAVALMITTAGAWTVAQNTFGTPKTIIHLSLIKWKAGVSDADKKKALDGVKEMAGKIPGIRNVWTKAVRMQPEGYQDAFVIEFENQAAVDRYSKDPDHDAWTKAFLAIREASLSPQITNE
jgi:Stress responsive A/B Barrel Domain